MKKTAMLLAFLAFCAFANAQLKTEVFPLSINKTADSVWYYQEVTGNFGAIQQITLFKPVIDTVWRQTPVYATNNPNFWRGFGAQPNTVYEFVSRVISGADTFTSPVVTVTTDTVPQHKQFTLQFTGFAFVQQQIQYRIHYADATYLIGVKAYQDQYLFVSPTLFLQGTGDTFIVAPVNVAETTYTKNELRGSPVLPITGVTSVYDTIPDYTVPSADAAHVVSITSIARGQDSLKIAIVVKPGNTGFSSGKAKILKGATVIDSVMLSTHTDTTFVPVFRSLPSSNTTYTITVVQTAAGGTDSMVVTITTLPVDDASIGSTWDTMNATISSTDLIATFNTNGNYDSSASRAVVKYLDKNGVGHVTDTTTWFTGPHVDTFRSLTNLRDATIGPNPVTIEVINKRGRKASYAINVYIAKPNDTIPIYWGIVYDEPNAVSIENLGLTVPAGDFADVFGFTQPDNSVGWDTTILYNHYTGSLPGLNHATVGGLQGDTKYTIRIGTRNSDNVWYVNPTSKIAEPTVGIGPVHLLAMAATTVTDTMATFYFTGAANGNSTQWSGEVYQYGTSNPICVLNPEFVGFNTFTLSKTATGLMPGTHCTLLSRVTNSAGTDTLTYDFWTTGIATDIAEAATDNAPKKFFAYDVTGRLIMETMDDRKLFETLSGLPGIVIIKTIQGNTTTSSKRVIVKH